MEYEELIQPKLLYCKSCNTFSEPDHRLTCGECGERLTTCWWALLCRRVEAKHYCDNCRNRFWCWTNTPDGRIPSITQARVVQNSYDISKSEPGGPTPPPRTPAPEVRWFG